MRRALLLVMFTGAVGCATSRPATLCATLAGAGPESDARDPDARGTAVLQLGGAHTVKFFVQTTGIGTVIATHIHRGGEGVIGPMAREINPGFPGESFRGAAADVPAELVAEVREHPERFYLKLHSLRFPGGAIRGQLVRCREDLRETSSVKR